LDVQGIPTRANALSATRRDDACDTYDSYSRCQHQIRINPHSQAMRQNRAKSYFRHNRSNMPNPARINGNIRTSMSNSKKTPKPPVGVGGSGDDWRGETGP
jgi:hypothetical protein